MCKKYRHYDAPTHTICRAVCVRCLLFPRHHSSVIIARCDIEKRGMFSLLGEKTGLEELYLSVKIQRCQSPKVSLR